MKTMYKCVKIVKKPLINRFKNKYLLHKVPFYNELSIKKVSKAFKRYARGYEIEIVDSKDTLAQLAASKLNVKDLFKDLLDRIKGFKYQITVKSSYKNTKKMGTWSLLLFGLILPLKQL